MCVCVHTCVYIYIEREREYFLKLCFSETIGVTETIKTKKKAVRGSRKSGKSSQSGRWQISWGPNPHWPSHFTGGKIDRPTSKTWAAMSEEGLDIFLRWWWAGGNAANQHI